MTARTSTKQNPAYDVAIVGVGPVGVTLTALLAAQGLRVLAVDAAPDVINLPRAIGLDQEVMRVFQEIGVADRMDAAVSTYHASEYRTASGDVIRRFESQEPPYPLAWPPYLTFLQPELERILRAHVRECETAELRLNTEVIALSDTDAQPRLTLRDRLTGDTEIVTARFAVGCDGGNSFVRQHLGIQFEDLVFDEPWIVVDMLLDADVDLPDVNVQYCDPARPHTFVVGPGNLRRWEFMLLPGEDPAVMSREDTVWQLLSPWLRPGQARLWRAAAYRFHALVAERWRAGRVFLAGDACHMTPPFLAQGMVQGIKDAANLGWKLAGVLKGAPETLLDTYEAERRPLVREVISIAKDLGAIICERDPVRADERNRRMLAEMASGSGISVRQNLFPPIGPGPLCQPRQGTEGAAGRPAPQPEILIAGGTARRLDDIVGPGFHLFARPGFVLDDATAGRLAALGFGLHVIATNEETGTLTEKDGTFRDWMAKHGCEAILVRPDHMVFSGFRSPAEVPAALDLLSPSLKAA